VIENCALSSCIHREPLGHFIFHYDSGISWWICELYVPMETGMNTLQNRCNFILNMFSIVTVCTLQFVMTVADCFLQCIWSNWLCTTWVQCLSFHFLLGYSLMSLRAENLLESLRFWSKFYLQNSSRFRTPFYCITITHEVTHWSEHCSVTQL